MVGTKAALIASARTRTCATDFSLWFLNLIINGFSLGLVFYLCVLLGQPQTEVCASPGGILLPGFFNWLSIGRLERPRRMIGNTGHRCVGYGGYWRSDLLCGFLLWQFLERRATQG